jgi:type IV pilus assembly protein PilE
MGINEIKINGNSIMFNYQIKLKNSSTKKQHGFTLIELMVVVAIIAILAAISFPSYTKYVQRGNRAEGRAWLMDTAALLERHYSDNNRYASVANKMPDTVAAAVGTSSETGKYTADWDEDGNMVVDTPWQTYTITATQQFNDTDCGDLTLTQAGVKGRTGGGMSIEDCWGK